MALKSGLQLYTYKLTGTIATPTGYDLFNYVRDESVDMDRTEVDASSRASVTFRQFVPGLSNGNVETQIMHLPGDTIFDAIQNAFFNNTVLLPRNGDRLQMRHEPDTSRPLKRIR